jgi:sodium-dependent dicarboxylate transporter 2/3/5
VLGTMLTTAVLSMFISNTATATVMLAALVPLLHWDSAADRRLGKSMLLAIAFGANLGGMGTVIGTPPNAIAAGALAGVQPVNFAQWMMIGIPPAIVLLVVAWLYLIIRYLGRDGFRIRDDLRPPSAHEVDADPIQQLIVVATFAATVVLWITSPLHGLPTTVVSFLPTCVLTATGTLKAEDIRGLPWDILLLISGGLALGVAIEDTGLATWIIGQVPTEGVSPTTVTLAIAGLALVLSNLMSNTATANMLMPIAIAMAPGSEVSLVIPLALSASAAMCLPISTPPNAIVYGSGRLSAADLLVAGLVVGILAPLLLTYWVPWVAPFCLAR